MKKNKLITGIVAGLVLFTLASGVKAVMTAEELEAKKDAQDLKKTEIEANRDAKSDEIDAKRGEIKEKRCDQVRSRIRKKIEKFNGNNKYHQKNFNGVEKNIEELVNLFKAEGLDTSELESYLAVLKTKLEKLYTDHDTFLEALEASTEVDCFDIEDGVKNKLQIAKQEGEVIREDILAVKDYYKDTIRPELIELKNEYLGLTGDGLNDKNEEAGSEREDLGNKED
ncbi:MAG: hypothetical protein PF549_00800 [Patescibacteria group bacterium]|jgi:hypothetical protein|nr:hypothetical protein [Patescibacteria group bacterium]